jgi:hypothetical protein
MLSLSLGRDGWVEAAAPAPALMRIAALRGVCCCTALIGLRWLHWRAPGVDGNCCTYAWGS